MNKYTTGTSTINKPKYNDWLTNELIEWVRNVPLESDAVANIPRILKYYEKRKGFWKKLGELIKQ